jgi:hypothetical protein
MSERLQASVKCAEGMVQHEWRHRRLLSRYLEQQRACALTVQILVHERGSGRDTFRTGGGGGGRKFASKLTFKNISRERPRVLRAED